MLDDENTKAMQKRNKAFLEDKILKKLRERAGLPEADFKELIRLSNYISWAIRSGLTLNFTLTDEEFKYVEIIIESQLYQDLGVYPD